MRFVSQLNMLHRWSIFIGCYKVFCLISLFFIPNMFSTVYIIIQINFYQKLMIFNRNQRLIFLDYGILFHTQLVAISRFIEKAELFLIFIIFNNFPTSFYLFYVIKIKTSISDYMNISSIFSIDGGKRVSRAEVIHRGNLHLSFYENLVFLLIQTMKEEIY